MKSSIKLLSVFLVIMTLVGCGLKGPLYYPTQEANTSIQSDIVNHTA
ncbi:LPS translocon maturation chaperone LptM [Gilliamella sp. wkB108]|nr:lipoprotein [Gilliamella apicola]